MRKIIFVCHGNICRSVAAEFIAKQLLKEKTKVVSMMMQFKEVKPEDIKKSKKDFK